MKSRRLALQSNQLKETSSERRGMVMIIVMIVIVMISLAGYSFLHALTNENKAAYLRGDEMQAESLVHSGVTVVQTLALQNRNERAELFADDLDEESLYKGALVCGEEDDIFRGRFTILSVNPAATTPAKFQYGPSNESAKLNLHALARWEKSMPNSGVNALLQLPHMTEPLANALMDWIDEDSISRSQGAESEYYGGLTPAYSSRNSVPFSLDELLLVRDVNRSMLYGNDLNYDFYVDAAERDLLSDEDSAETLTEDQNASPWNWLLTVHSAERNENSAGEPLINVNESDLTKLHKQVAEKLGEEWANFIVAYRQSGPASEVRDASAFNNAEPAANLKIDLAKKAGDFPINSLLTLVGTTVKQKITKPGETEETEVIYASPLGVNGDLSLELPNLFEALTVEADPVVVGRVNLNLASEPVLRGIPNMDETTLEAIQSARENGPSAAEEGREYPIWPLLEELVTIEKMEQILPYLTCGGNVYKAQVVGFYDQKGPSMRAEVIIDGTQPPGRVVKWLDLRMQGQPFPPELLGVQSDELGLDATNLN